ncbi:response regulator transcription factor [Paenibacillus arenilitoris]|uniref:Response regulator transcription factor n=1 Tax=Paenibacillus arenilitoris TaxID=2772299 RepID=A0A927CQH2_9BACL|nr:response regulator transcription factor [Paenibacillus arenilitoris]MBD2870071.1 response regulator transcription factor [Paenibacillus arenilitoris]
MIRVLVVDDDPFIRESMRVILSLDPELEVVGVCGNGKEAAEFALLQQVDVVLMDIRMPVCDGVEGAKLLRSLDRPPAVLILTTFDDDEYIAQAIRNGANGYLLKNVPPSRIISGIKTVHEGSVLIHPDVARKLVGMLDATRGGDPGKALAIQGLTQTESQIVRLISEGQSNKEIAAALFLSEGTVKNYISDILSKLELRDRTQIAIYYLKL